MRLPTANKSVKGLSINVFRSWPSHRGISHSGAARPLSRLRRDDAPGARGRVKPTAICLGRESARSLQSCRRALRRAHHEGRSWCRCSRRRTRFCRLHSDHSPAQLAAGWRAQPTAQLTSPRLRSMVEAAQQNRQDGCCAAARKFDAKWASEEIAGTPVSKDAPSVHNTSLVDSGR